MRDAKIYFGNAAQFDKNNLIELKGYQVDEEGNVYGPEGLLKKYIRNKYHVVKVNIAGKEKWCKVHRIVATTFQDICGEFNEVVNHCDEDKLNNKASNLKWCTDYENLHWGNIEKARQKTINKNREIRSAAKECCKMHNIPWSKVKIKEFKKCYRIDGNTFRFYTIGHTPQIDFKRSGLKEIPVEIQTETPQKGLDHLLELLTLFPEHIPEFKYVLDHIEEIRKVEI